MFKKIAPFMQRCILEYYTVFLRGRQGLLSKIGEISNTSQMTKVVRNVASKKVLKEAGANRTTDRHTELSEATDHEK